MGSNTFDGTTGKAFKAATAADDRLASLDARGAFVRPRPFPGIPKLLPALVRLELGKRLVGLA